MARYAENTKVSVSQSQAEIKDMLRKLGADRIAVFEDRAENYIVFQLPPSHDRPEFAYKLSQPRPDTSGKTAKQADQLERSLWRALVLLVKAKKVAIEGGITTVEREFMADTVMPDGSTLIDHYQAVIGHNYQDGPPQIGFSAN